MTRRNRQEIEALLLRLTEWQRMSRFDPSTHTDSEFATTGESYAAIEDLKQKLDRLGAHYHWSESAGEYQLDYINTSPERTGESEVSNG